MAEFDLGIDILRNVVRRAGEMLPTDVSTEAQADHYIDVKIYINRAYWEICALKPWRWARKRTQFVSIAQVTGTVTSIVGATVTLSATIATSMAGRKFYLESDGIPFRITAHTAGTDTLTLSASYTGTNTSGSFIIFQDEITVASDILAFPVLTQLHFWDDITIIPESESLGMSPRNIYGTTRSLYAAFITDSVIRLVPWTMDPHLFQVSYNYRPDPLDFGGLPATDTPILPRDDRIVIAQRSLELLATDKRDARLQEYKTEVRESLARMSAKESTFVKPRVRPRPGSTVGGWV